MAELQDGLTDWFEHAIEWIVACVLDTIARGGDADPLALTLLLRAYRATGRDDIEAALGPALAAAAEQTRGAAAEADPNRLMMFAEAAGASGDPRLREAGATLIASCRRHWGHRADIGSASWTIDACLTAADLADPRELIPAAIDELERIVGVAYRPGQPIGQLADHVRTAAALLTAYARTDRVPYAMLAEELMQTAVREFWNTGEDGFVDKSLLLNCEAARVLTRLAVLQATSAYRTAAVDAPGVDYDDHAARILLSFEPHYREHGANAAIYGLALSEWAGRS